LTDINCAATTYGAALVTAPATKASGVFQRFFDALVEARMKRAVCEISRHAHLMPADALQEAGFEDASVPIPKFARTRGTL